MLFIVLYYMLLFAFPFGGMGNKHAEFQSTNALRF